MDEGVDSAETLSDCYRECSPSLSLSTSEEMEREKRAESLVKRVSEREDEERKEERNVSRQQQQQQQQANECEVKLVQMDYTKQTFIEPPVSGLFLVFSLLCSLLSSRLHVTWDCSLTRLACMHACVCV